MEFSHIAIVGFSGFFGAFGAWFIARWGIRFSLMDESVRRSSHEGMVPKGGGVGILVGFMIACWLLNFPAAVWSSVGFISLLSLYGDRRGIGPKTRLTAQFIASVVLVLGFCSWEGRGWLAYALLPLFSVFVVGTANYYNFMDGINGIAGIAGVIGFGLLALFAGLFSAYDESTMILAICLGAACLGFLPFNMPKARVFMGDVGSILLGFTYAGLVVGLAENMTDFFVLCGLLFPFYADELTTAYVRLRDGEHLMNPHRRHVYQLLANELGLEHWKVSIGYGVLQGLVGMSLLVFRDHGLLIILSLLFIYFVAFAAIGYYVRLLVRSMPGRN